jgi:hypothetical protein
VWGQAQKQQKNHYDKKSTSVPFRPGERVFLYKPVEKTGEARKLARPFYGPYRIVDMDSNTATTTRIDRPEEELLLVAIEKLRRRPDEIGPGFWPADGRRKKKNKPGEAVDRHQSEVSESVDGHAGGPTEETDLGLTSTDLDPEREVGPTPSNSQDGSVLPPQQHATETESEH